MSSQSKHTAGPGAGTGFGVIAATAFVAVGTVAIVFLSDAPAAAAERAKQSSATARPDIERPPVAPGASSERASRGEERRSPPAAGYPRPPLLPRLEPRRLLGPADEIAALEAVQIALSEVGDGASYVWHRDHGRLSGVVRPTASFLDSSGQICRHLHVLLTSGEYVRRAEGVACRDRQGVWSLEG